jgi:hypothetical protein
VRKAILLSLVLFVLPGASRAETPSNGWIVFASDRQDGRHEIYLMKADGTNVSRLTTTGAKFPMWSPDGAWIAYRTEPTLRTRVMRWDQSGDKEIFSGAPLFFMHDNSGLVCADGDDLYLVDPDSGSSQYLFTKDDFPHLVGKTWEPGGISRDGRWLVAWSDRYRNGYAGTNGTFDSYHCAVILDIQNKGDIFFFGGGCEPTTPPSGTTFYHVCGNCDTYPDVYRMAVADRMSRSSYTAEMAHEDADWGHEYFPRISTDGVWLTYGATTGCHDHDTCQYEILVHRLGAGNDNREQVTNNSNNDQWAHLYVGDLWGQQPELTTVRVSPSTSSILPGGRVDLTAACRDQFDAPFAAVIAWSASAGGSLAPPDSGQAVTEHTSTFSSDGSEGTFTVTAAAGGVQGTASVQVEDTPAEEPGQDGGDAPDGGTADDADAGIQPDAGDEKEDAGTPPSDAGGEIVVQGGCSGCATSSGHPAALLLIPLIALLRRRN